MKGWTMKHMSAGQGWALYKWPCRTRCSGSFSSSIPLTQRGRTEIGGHCFPSYWKESNPLATSPTSRSQSFHCPASASPPFVSPPPNKSIIFFLSFRFMPSAPAHFLFFHSFCYLSHLSPFPQNSLELFLLHSCFYLFFYPYSFSPLSPNSNTQLFVCLHCIFYVSIDKHKGSYLTATH